jgi:hypothetical protein
MSLNIVENEVYSSEQQSLLKAESEQYHSLEPIYSEEKTNEDVEEFEGEANMFSYVKLF